MARKPLDLPSVRGKIPYEVEQAIERLRQGVEDAFAHSDQIANELDARGPHYSLADIQQALSPTGAYPIATAALLNTTPAQSNPVPSPPTPPPPNPGDGGEGGLGCAAHPPTGHVGGSSLSPFTAGQIVCGTGEEWSALLAPTANEDDRTANAIALLRRMIWHLQIHGFTAGRQQNPSGLISNDKLTVYTEQESVLTLRAYDVMSLTAHTEPMTTHMVEVFPAVYVVDSGIPD